MADPAQTHYVNADFDLSLSRSPFRLDRPAMIRQIRELSAQALLGASPGDSALLRTEVPCEFLEYLERCGASVPRVLRHPHIDPSLQFRPFGWSEEAAELNRSHATPAKHPSAEIVEHVNARSFGLELEAELYPDHPGAVLIADISELERLLATGAATTERVIKAEHGNSGLGNRRLKGSSLSRADRGFVERILAQGGRAVVEPWCARQRDWSVVFQVPFDAGSMRIHETTYTRDGALIGALFEPVGHGQSDRVEELTSMAERVAPRLAASGYFGPVCVDAFTWIDGDVERFRPLVDLNCRASMSDGAYRLWQRIAPTRTLYYRFFNRRKLMFPDELRAARSVLGERHFDLSRRGGILFASPLRFGVGDDGWRPTKIATIFVAEDLDSVFELERSFRARFEV